MKAHATIYFSTILLFVKCLNCNPVVQIGYSKIIGQTIPFGEYVVNQFLSVPYAQPPIGQLRFRKPEPILNYPNDIHACKPPPMCPQYTDRPFQWIANSTDKSEDCLHLNIWTPSDASLGNRKAVLYFIHGGGFRYGSIRLPLYSGIPLAAIGDIIVVTVNYRVGPFGFLTSGTQDAPGNVGFWDILEGLRWVNRYISYFGGDTSRITIAGQSAGSWAVGLLSVSPLAEGLYRRQIMQSSAPTYLAAENNTQNLAFSQRIAETVGCASPAYTIKDNPGPVIQCLREINPTTLAMADYPLLPNGLTTFIPQYGDEILPVNARISILRGNFRCTELLIGSNHDEGSLVLTAVFRDMFGFFGEKKTLFNKSTAADLIREAFKDFPDPESVVKHYLPESLPEYPSATVRYQTHTAIGDMSTVCPGLYQAEKCAEIGGSVYSYFFNHRPSISPYAPWAGVVHFDECQFLFGSPLLNPSKYTQEEQWVSRQIIEIWSSFAKDGKPCIPLVCTSMNSWPLYSKEIPLIKFLGPWIVTGEDGIGPHRDNCDFFRPFFFKSV